METPSPMRSPPPAGYGFACTPRITAKVLWDVERCRPIDPASLPIRQMLRLRLAKWIERYGYAGPVDRQKDGETTIRDVDDGELSADRVALLPSTRLFFAVNGFTSGPVPVPADRRDILRPAQDAARMSGAA